MTKRDPFCHVPAQGPLCSPAAQLGEQTAAKHKGQRSGDHTVHVKLMCACQITESASATLDLNLKKGQMQ